MRDVIQCLIDWLKDNPSETKAHRILRALANESLKKADLDENLGRFDSMDIAVAANEKKESTGEANEWIDWKRTVQKYWETRETDIIDFARKKKLDSYPKPDRISTEGGPDVTTYLIKAERLPEIFENTSTFHAEANSKPKVNIIHYEKIANGDVKPAWIAKWLLHNGQIRLSRWHIRVILGCLFILGGGTFALSFISWLGFTIPKPITTRELTTLISTFGLPYLVWVVFIKFWWSLFEERIVVAPEILVSIKEKSAQIEFFRDGDLRMIRLVRYSAPCPICGATIHIDKGEPDYPRRLVGRCYDSPREHVFSFDWITKRGVILRGAELITPSEQDDVPHYQPTLRNI